MILQSTPEHLHLFCHLVNQEPPCQWRGLLARAGPKWELREVPGREHNEASPAVEQRTGFASTDQLERARKGLQSVLVVQPQAILFDMRNDADADSSGLLLSQVQNLKKLEHKGGAVCREAVGDLATFLEEHSAIPEGVERERQGYPTGCAFVRSFHKRPRRRALLAAPVGLQRAPTFRIWHIARQMSIALRPRAGPADFSVRDVRVQEDGRPRITMVATTPLLQRRATSCPSGTSAIDGGHGFCVYGFPLIMKGEMDRTGHCAPTELMLTSTMTMEHVREAIQGAAASNEAFTGRSARKAFSMSDGELAFIQNMRQVHSSQPLMCFFHVVKAVRAYVMTHAALDQDKRRLLPSGLRQVPPPRQPGTWGDDDVGGNNEEEKEEEEGEPSFHTYQTQLCIPPSLGVPWCTVADSCPK